MTEREDRCPCTPRGEARRQAMIDATWDAVLEKGFAAVTLADIIERSGGSKSTLYASFGGKEGLLVEALRERVQVFAAQLRVTLRSDEDPARALREFARAFARRMMDKDASRFYYLMVAEAQHMGPLIAQFLEEGPAETQRCLAEYLAEANRDGKLVVEDPDAAADLFLSMLQGQCVFNAFAHALDGEALEAHNRQIAARAEATVGHFLRATLPRGAAAR